MPKRRSNGHPIIAPYQVFRAADGDVIVAVGNDSQFQRFVEWLGKSALAHNTDYSTNPARLANRDALIVKLKPLISKHSAQTILDGLEASKIPVGPVNKLDTVFASDQVKARDMKVQMATEATKNHAVELIGNPLKFSKTPITYRHPPPRLRSTYKRSAGSIAKN